MALDSNSPGDDRGASGVAEKTAATGLKLVAERGSAAGTAPGSGRSTGPTGGVREIAGSGPTPVRRRDRKQGRQLPLWLFVALLVLFLIAYGYQTRQAGQLESEVARLEASLAMAEARLESHRTHLLEIRSGVHDLSSRLESLRSLIDRDPNAEPESSATAKPPIVEEP